MNSKIKTLIADDHPLFLKGLKYTLRIDESIEIVGEARDGEAAIELIERTNPDIAVIDYDMPKCNGLCVAEYVKNKNLNVKIIVLTMHGEYNVFSKAIKLNVKGYILKDRVENEILEAVHEVYNEGIYITPVLSGYLIQNCEISELDNLTPTEMKVLKLVAENKTTKEIGAEMFISPRTVDRHRSNICGKLNISGNNALIKYVLERRKEIINYK